MFLILKNVKYIVAQMYSLQMFEMMRLASLPDICLE
jgi:hypothetical protein